jgi:dTDP-4-dehydrorhamnose reductase
MGCPRIDAGPIPPRAGNVSMDSSKLRQALGYEPFHSWPYDESLVPTHRDWHFDRLSHDPGSEAFLAEVLYRNPLRAQD